MRRVAAHPARSDALVLQSLDELSATARVRLKKSNLLIKAGKRRLLRRRNRSQTRANVPPLTPLLLSPSLQHYAWGDSHFIPAALGLIASERSGAEAPETPCAEAWYGAHPQAPAAARLEGLSQPLDQVIAAQPELCLGRAVAERFGALPYLLKLLAAAKPLSIQVHPNQEQALAGFAREEEAGIPRQAAQRCYRDSNHKPELLVALTPFDALCGFRAPLEIAERLRTVPELGPLLEPFEPSPAGLRTLLTAYFALPLSSVEPALVKLLERLSRQDSESAFTPKQPEYWALAAHRALSSHGRPDRGLLFAFLLEHVQLQPGQGMFLPAGVPHAYLRGAGVELMASSDNVLRAGLTPKHVDVEELLRVVRFDAGAPPILEALVDADGVEGRYALPVNEFELRRVKLQPGTSLSFVAHGPETLLCLLDGSDGFLNVTCNGTRLELRRGQACLVPDGLAYQIEVNATGQLFRARVPGGESAGSFRGRKPTPLAFGTSGLRGLVSDITDLEAYVNARGFIDYLIAAGDAVPGSSVALAGDLRPSTDGKERSILKAVARAVSDAGLLVDYCGRVPTPALTYYGLQKTWPSIMVTGSHIPFDRNGIKFNRSNGEVLKSDEAGILEAVARVRVREYARAPENSLFDDAGMLRAGQALPLPSENPEATRLYARRYWDAFPPDALAGLRIALYEHSAVGRELVKEIFEGLGAEVFPIARSESFVAIDTEAVQGALLQQLQKLADAAQAQFGRLDALVSTDGDSDRPLLLAIDDAGRVRFFGGDVLGAVVADALGADAIVVPISSNDLIERHFVPRGVRIARTRIGSPWVIEAMRRFAGSRCVGWEANGGFLTGSALALGRKPLLPLPTRDAVLPLVGALYAARQRGQTLLELFAGLPRRYGCSGLMDQVPQPSSRGLLECFALPEGQLRRVRLQGERFYWMAMDGREAVAEGSLALRCSQLFKALGRHFSAERGFGPLLEVDTLDGLRLRFEGDDVAHVRPSGNAPQLRIYALADDEARAEQIVSLALAEPAGLLREMLAAADEFRFVRSVRRNIEHTRELFATGEPPQLLGTVSGSAEAQGFWQHQLDAAREAFRAQAVLSLHEDLPVNQAFGLLLMWQRLRPHLQPGHGALMAFVFGEGSRAAPFTEAECGQKPALSSYAASGVGAARFRSIVELALQYFAPVEAYLRRSGFDGVVVKWGDEVQIPTLDLSGKDALFEGADIVRFVSMCAMTEDGAANKDWVGIDDSSRVTAFIPRRPLAEMEVLAERGWVQKRDGRLYGGINLGSIGVSRALLDGLLEEFSNEVNDPDAKRSQRPDLDPQLFTALTIAALEAEEQRQREWSKAVEESPAMRKLDVMLPQVVERLRGVLERFEARHGRKVRMVAMDFGEQYWGDVGQHRQMFELYMALNAAGASGEIARALAGFAEAQRDEHGNLLVGGTRLGAGVRARNSVLIGADIDAGSIEGSVLIGTRAGRIEATQAFDVQSTVLELTLKPRAGSYKLVSEGPLCAQAGERLTTVFVPDSELLMRVHEDTDLRERASNYDAPILGNALSFREAHERVTRADPLAIAARRRAEMARVEALRKRQT